MTDWEKRVYFCDAVQMYDGCYTTGLLICCYSYASFACFEYVINYSHREASLEVTEQWLRWLVTDLSLQRPRFDPIPVHMGFVVDKIVL